MPYDVKDKCGCNSVVEWLPSKQFVVGSNPIIRSREISSAVAASVLHAESPQFESVISH